MKIARSVWATLLLATVCAAQNFNRDFVRISGNPQPPSAEIPAGKSVLTGRVVNSKSKEPIKKARVTLNGPVSLSAVTDGSGSFTFRALPAGGYMVSASHDDYYVDQSGLNVVQQVNVGEGEEKHDAEVDLVPGASIRGRVLDEDELPVPRCAVTALRFDRMRGRKQLLGNNSANTDDQGRYHLQNLQSGRHILRAQCHNTVPAPHGFMKRNDLLIPVEGYAPVYSAGSQQAPDAAGIPITAGDALEGIDFHVQRVPVFVVRGTVSGVDPSLAANVQVMLVPGDAQAGDEGVIPAARDDNRGRFIFQHVPAGTYELSAVAFNADRVYHGRQALTVGKAQITEFDLKMTPGSALAGTLEIDDPNQHFENMQVSLQPVDAGYRGPIPIATLAADGSFEFKSILPGHFMLNPLPVGFVKALTLAGRDVSPRDFEIGEGAGPMHITSGSKMAQVEVDVSPPPAAGQIISGLLIEDDGPSGMAERNSMTVGPNAHLSFQGISPGKYHVLVTATANAWNMVNHPEVLKSLSSRTVSVEVAEGDNKHLAAGVVSVDDLQKAFAAER